MNLLWAVDGETVAVSSGATTVLFAIVGAVVYLYTAWKKEKRTDQEQQAKIDADKNKETQQQRDTTMNEFRELLKRQSEEIVELRKSKDDDRERMEKRLDESQKKEVECISKVSALELKNAGAVLRIAHLEDVLEARGFPVKRFSEEKADKTNPPGENQ